jgi:hypothetical protein
MLVVALLAWPAMHYLNGSTQRIWLIVFSIPLLASTLGPAVLYSVSQRTLHPSDWRERILLLPVLMLVGFGICISNTRAVFEAIFGIKSGFIRTPKRGTVIAKRYRPVADRVPLLEIAAGIYCAVTIVFYVRSGNYGIVPFLALYVAGFSLVGWSSLREQFHNKGNA